MPVSQRLTGLGRGQGLSHLQRWDCQALWEDWRQGTACVEESRDKEGVSLGELAGRQGRPPCAGMLRAPVGYRGGDEAGGSCPAVQGLTWASEGGSQPALLLGLQCSQTQAWGARGPRVSAPSRRRGRRAGEAQGCLFASVFGSPPGWAPLLDFCFPWQPEPDHLGVLSWDCGLM